MTEAQDERQRRWRARIDLVGGQSQVHPVETDPRMSPAASQLLDALNRPARSRPEHHSEPREEEAESAQAMPLNPWQHRFEPTAAQPQDIDRRGGLDVRVPPAPQPEPAPQPFADPFRAVCERVAEDVMARLRPILGLPPADPVARELYGDALYTVLNPAGAFVTVDPGVGADATEADPAGWQPEETVNPAGAFVDESG